MKHIIMKMVKNYFIKLIKEMPFLNLEIHQDIKIKMLSLLKQRVMKYLVLMTHGMQKDLLNHMIQLIKNALSMILTGRGFK